MAGIRNVYEEKLFKAPVEMGSTLTVDGLLTVSGGTSGLIDTTASHIKVAGSQSAGSQGAPPNADHVHPISQGGWVPAWNGLLGSNGSLHAALSNTATPTKGAPVYMKLYFYEPKTVTNLVFGMSSVGSGASTQTFAGLLSSSGSVLTSSSDVSSGFTGAAPGLVSCALTTPQNFNAGDFCWAVGLFNFATTQPTLFRYGGAGSVTILNNGQTAATFNFASQGTLQTAINAITPSSNGSTNAFSFFVGYT